jgi:hypothetical protein
MDKGQLSDYIPRQAEEGLKSFGVMPENCQKGMILMAGEVLEHRSSGSDAEVSTK